MGFWGKTKREAELEKKLEDNSNNFFIANKKQKEDLDKLYSEKLIIMSKNDSLNRRVIELENAIQKDYKVNIRQEVKTVNVEFTKLEMAIMLAAIGGLIKNSSAPQDLKTYISLNDKILGFIGDMKENVEDDQKPEPQPIDKENI